MSPMTPSQKFVESLRTIRQHRGMSMQDVCDLPGVTMSRTGYWELESGKRKKLSLDEAIELSSALGFSLELMLDGTAPHYVGLPELVSELVDRLDAITGRDND